jgi:hypothetical protein
MHLNLPHLLLFELMVSPPPGSWSLRVLDELSVAIESKLASGSDYVWLHDGRVSEISHFQSFRKTANSFLLKRY